MSTTAGSSLLQPSAVLIMVSWPGKGRTKNNLNVSSHTLDPPPPTQTQIDMANDTTGKFFRPSAQKIQLGMARRI